MISLPPQVLTVSDILHTPSKGFGAHQIGIFLNIVLYIVALGTMSARGILENPALFAGYDVTPWECIEDYIDIALSYGTNAFIFHHHLMSMFEHTMSNAGNYENNNTIEFFFSLTQWSYHQLTMLLLYDLPPFTKRRTQDVQLVDIGTIHSRPPGRTLRAQHCRKESSETIAAACKAILRSNPLKT